MCDDRRSEKAAPGGSCHRNTHPSGDPNSRGLAESRIVAREGNEVGTSKAGCRGRRGRSTPRTLCPPDASLQGLTEPVFTHESFSVRMEPQILKGFCLKPSITDHLNYITKDSTATPCKLFLTVGCGASLLEWSRHIIAPTCGELAFAPWEEL